MNNYRVYFRIEDDGIVIKDDVVKDVEADTCADAIATIKSSLNANDGAVYVYGVDRLVGSWNRC